MRNQPPQRLPCWSTFSSPVGWRYLNEEYIIEHMYRRIKISCMLHVEWSSYVQYITPIKWWDTQLHLFRDLKKKHDLSFPPWLKTWSVATRSRPTNRRIPTERNLSSAQKNNALNLRGPVANKNRPWSIIAWGLKGCWSKAVCCRNDAWYVLRRRSLIGSERI